MSKYKKMEWFRFNREKLTTPFDVVIDHAISRELQLGYKLKICIGCDSQVKGNRIDFATVVLILREKKGGFMFYKINKKTGKMSIKERMIHEVSLAVNTAYDLCPVLDKYPVSLEVHADINTDPGFKSHTALKDAMGYILGMGYIFKSKPDAFASSYCADRFVH